MANTVNSYSDLLIMKCLLTGNFSEIGRSFEDNVITKLKPGAFYQAQNLDRVSIPNLKDIGAFAFAGTSLTTLDIPWAEIEAVRTGAFYECVSSGMPSTFNLAKATVVDRMAFAGTSSKPNTWLQSISIPIWTGTSSGTEKYYSGTTTGVFEYCTALTNVSLPELVGLTTKFFSRDSSLVSVKLPKCATVAGEAFSYCTALTKVELGGALTSYIANMFAGCSALEALILSGVTAVPTLSSSAFSGTRIANKNAYIYVPKSLEETFKLANNWSTYASQIRAIEDYPDVCGS